MEDSKDIKDAHEYLQERWPLLLESYRAIMRRDLFITSSYRSPQTQQRLFQQGRTTPGNIVTNIDGFQRVSKHNFYPSRAIDVCVDLDLSEAVKPTWSDPYYEPLGYICKQIGLVWGGDWKTFKDKPHIEVPLDVR